MNSVSKNISDAAWKQLRYPLDNQLKEQDVNQVYKVSNQVSDQIRNQLWLQLCDQVKQNIKL
jgi:hypothetical protein